MASIICEVSQINIYIYICILFWVLKSCILMPECDLHD